jgi:integrase/recombinase XerD
VTNKLIPRDPTTAALVHLASRAMPQYLTREAVQTLVDACRSDRDRLFVRVGFETGGRVSELITIRRCDVDLPGRQIRLRTLKQRRDRRRRREEVFRWIPVSASLCADLGAYMLRYSKRDTIYQAVSETYRLFPFTRQAAFKIIRQAGKRAGILARGGREISPHILRHSFAKNCVSQGVPINVLKELLGHASIASTMIYLKVEPGEARTFLQKVQF